MRNTMQPEIEKLMQLVGVETWRNQIDFMAREIPLDFDKAIIALFKLDSSIPGLGQHNVNRKISEGHWTGVYRVEDRPIFRGIQYVGNRLEMKNLEWLSRMIVIESCYHVENALKRKTGITARLSVGMILDRISNNIPFDNELYTALRLLNRAIYNEAKHTIEDIDMDSHMFSVNDAIAIYLICRILGARLLKGLGITTQDGRILFP